MRRENIKAACRFFGGIKPVAIAANVDDGNLSRWLRGGSTLSESRVQKVLEVLGVPNGQVDLTRVHLWQLNKVMFSNLIPALKLYFPDGAEIAKAPWAVPGVKSAVRFLSGNTPPPAVYAITDGNAKAVLRLVSNLLLQPKNYRGFLHWKNGEEDRSLLGISEGDQKWISGPLTLREFTEAWTHAVVPATAEDLIDVVRGQGISFEEAIRIIQEHDKKKAQT